MKHDPNWMFCQCEQCQEATFEKHRSANIAAGRPNDGCACGSCRAVQAHAVGRAEAGFKKLEELEATRKRIDALKKYGL